MECVEVCQNEVLTGEFINMVKLTLKDNPTTSENMFQNVLIANPARTSVNNMQYGLLIQNGRNYNDNYLINTCRYHNHNIIL